MDGFAPATAGALKSYVYALVDPRSGRAFYVGRGRGDRCFDHVAAARVGGTSPVGPSRPNVASADAADAAGTVTGATGVPVRPAVSPLPAAGVPVPGAVPTAGADGAGAGTDPGNGTGDGASARAVDTRPTEAGTGADRTGKDAATVGDDGRFPQLDRIRAIEAGGREVRIDILRYGLDSKEARLAEAVARDALGLAGVTDGRKVLDSQRVAAGALDTLLAEPVRIKRSHPLVLLRLTVGGDDDGLSPAMATGPGGAGWRLGRRWADPAAPRAPRHALGVVDGVARAAWRITAWRPLGRDRYTLVGDDDADLARYLGKSVAAYQGAPSPVTYVWCGPHWVNSAG